jgi:bifunctional DNA-binding transcriptional regulator/antitoxin component of YhaV-PrlF toxin-antitoxin module
MPKTDIVKVYQSKGNSDTLAVVIPKEMRNSLKLKKGDRLKASLDPKKGFLIYKPEGSKTIIN